MARLRGEGARAVALARHPQKAGATQHAARASGAAMSGTVPFSPAVVLRRDDSLLSYSISIMIRLMCIVYIGGGAYFLQAFSPIFGGGRDRRSGLLTNGSSLL